MAKRQKKHSPPTQPGTPAPSIRPERNAVEQSALTHDPSAVDLPAPAPRVASTPPASKATTTALAPARKVEAPEPKPAAPAAQPAKPTSPQTTQPATPPKPPAALPKQPGPSSANTQPAREPSAVAPSVAKAVQPVSLRPAPAAPAPVRPPEPEPARPSPSVEDLPAISEEQIVKELPAIKPPVEEIPPEHGTDLPPPAAPTSQIPPMFIIMVTPELAPVAKVGGLADVTFGLARELELRGNAVEIILPKYDCMRYDHIWGLTRTYENLWVPWSGGAIHCSVWFGFVHGRKCFFIEPHSSDNFFNRHVIYGHRDDVTRFAFFSRAALEFMLKTGKQPEIIHCHDWQTGLVPVLLYEMYQHLGMRHSRVCYTIHNFRHQGVTRPQVLQATGLNRPEYFLHYDRLRDPANPSAINLMKGGIVYSNFVSTVSPRHAWEAKDAGQGHGLEHTLHIHQGKYGGVLNGLDYEMFNPESDGHLAAQYGVQNIERKYENKRALRNRFWLADNEKPIVAFVGRLDSQKGLDLVRHAIFQALQNRAQFVLLGSAPDKATNDHFWGLKHHLNNSPDCHLEIGYNLELAHLIYAGADMMIVPSRYEPCGLTQLISMRYGTVPIVRAVGGLADTVFDKDFSHRPLHERNGYVFHHPDNAGIESALHRAIACYYQFPEHFRHLMLNGMRCDCSWKGPGQHYLNIYDYIRDK